MFDLGKGRQGLVDAGCSHPGVGGAVELQFAWPTRQQWSDKRCNIAKRGKVHLLNGDGVSAATSLSLLKLGLGKLCELCIFIVKAMVLPLQTSTPINLGAGAETQHSDQPARQQGRLRAFVAPFDDALISYPAAETGRDGSPLDAMPAPGQVVKRYL